MHLRLTVGKLGLSSGLFLLVIWVIHGALFEGERGQTSLECRGQVYISGNDASVE